MWQPSTTNAVLLAGALTLSGAAAAETATPAELILVSDQVLTMASHRQQPAEALAVAVRDGRIVAVEKPAAMAPWQGPKTRVVELGDRALLPGFIDAHGHVAFVGSWARMANVASPPVGPVETIADLQAALKAYIAEHDIPAGEWVIGTGYDDSLLAEQRHPTRDDLDAVSGEHAIALGHVSGHLATANSTALARAGITGETEDPSGGVIRRRPGSREPNGVLEETATYPMRRFMNPPGDPIQNIGEAMRIYAANGITTAQDGGSSAQLVQLLRAADTAGQVPIDVIAFPAGQNNEIAIRDGFTYGEYQGRVKVGGIKLMLDGSPQGKTAYMTAPYKVPPPGQDATYRGYPNIPQPRVDELVKFYSDAGIPMLAHANGDAAADMLIDAVAAAAPGHDHRTVMIHAQTVREDQLTRMKNLAIVPSFFAAHSFYWGDWHRDSVFGVARAERISPTASTVARGMPFTIHNDAPVVPPDVPRLLWATTNRMTRSGKVLGKNQRISTYDALRAVTSLAAYQHFEENLKGSIEEGKQADFVVLSANPLTLATEDLLSLEVLATFSRGEQVYAMP